MKKTTYIEGLTLRYSCEVIDRTGVDAANAQDRAEAQAIIRDMRDALQVTDEEWDETCYEMAAELMHTGADQTGRVRSGNPDTLCADSTGARGARHRPDNRQHGTGIVRAVALSLLFWIPAVIWAIVHYTQKAGLPW